LQKRWPSGLPRIPKPKLKPPAGGESLDWSATTRDRLRSLGEQAGFIVAELYELFIEYTIAP
jgi:hypothetical protein